MLRNQTVSNDPRCLRESLAPSACESLRPLFLRFPAATLSPTRGVIPAICVPLFGSRHEYVRTVETELPIEGQALLILHVAPAPAATTLIYLDLVAHRSNLFIGTRALYYVGLPPVISANLKNGTETCGEPDA
jgi:hypothetical protein